MAKTRADITHNGRLKRYPDGSFELMAASAAVFKEPGWELSDKWDTLPKKREVGPPKAESRARAMRRARAQVRDLALCNEFRWFVTLTLDREKIDRYDMGQITKRLNAWLSNQVRRRGLRYILVPERHKDGAIHFHGFFSDALEAVPSGHRDGAGHMIFNLPRWNLGFTAAIEIYGEYAKAVSYVCKYIGKQGDKPGGRWYYSGGELARPETELVDIASHEIKGLPGSYTFCVEAAGVEYTIWRGRDDGTGAAGYGDRAAGAQGICVHSDGTGGRGDRPGEGLCHLRRGAEHGGHGEDLGGFGAVPAGRGKE